MIVNVLKVLDYVHSKGIIHRDIKPDNIIVRSSDKFPVLIDFGAVKETMCTILTSQGIPTTSIIIGTPGYMPNEQAAGKPVRSSDLYSFGLTAIYALTGKIPRDLSLDHDTGNIIWHHYAQNVSLELIAILDKAIECHPRERYTKAKDMLDAIDALPRVVTAHTPTVTIQPKPSSSKLPPPQNLQHFQTILPPPQNPQHFQTILPPPLIHPVHENKFVIYFLFIITIKIFIAIVIFMLFQISPPKSTPMPSPEASLLKKEIMTLTGHKSPVNTVAFSPDGKTLVTGSDDKNIIIWNLSTGIPMRTLSGHQGLVYSIALAKDGKTIVSGSADKTVIVWNLETGEKIHTLNEHDDLVNSVAISPDSKTIVSGSYDKTVKSWDLNTGKVLHTLKGHLKEVLAVAISPDGQTVASGSADTTIKLWNLKTGQEISTMNGHSSHVNWLNFSPDGQLLASASRDNTIKIWNLNAKVVVKTLTGSIGEVYTVAFSPDGQKIASGGLDKTIKIWALNSDQLLETLSGHSGAIFAVTFSPDGNNIASASDDHKIKIWHLYH